MNTDIAFSLLNFASGGIATLLSIGIIVVGLVHVRRVNALAGYCFAAAGFIGAFGSIIRRFASLATSFFGGTAVYTASQIFATLLSLLGGLLLPVGIFLLAQAVKQRTNTSW